MTTSAGGTDQHAGSVSSTASEQRGLPQLLERGRDRADRAGRLPFGHRSIRRLMVLYMLVALGAFVLCGVVLAVAQRQAALQESVRDAQVTTTLLVTRVVQPALPRTAPSGLGADRSFDQLVRDRVLDASINQVQIVDESGVVVYATATGLVGQQADLSTEELNAMHSSVATASGGDGSDPTRLMGGRTGQSLDVSVGLRAPSGQVLLMQTRQPYGVVWLTSRAVWLTLVPSLVLALSLLYLAKIGFAYRLTRSLYGVQEEREQLLVTALAAADRERTLIASDLHDGVVQGLAGASYTLSDTANRARSGGQPEVADTLAEIARNLRQWVRELRSLIVTVTPPALHTEGLQATLTDLVAPLEARGITVTLDVQMSNALTETGESLVYRVAQEAIRNIVRHASASNVELIVEEGRRFKLQITDDGHGFDPSSVSTRRQGSVGLTLLAALVQQRGGRLRVESALGLGTTVTLRMPLDAVRDDTVDTDTDTEGEPATSKAAQ